MFFSRSNVILALPILTLASAWLGFACSHYPCRSWSSHQYGTAIHFPLIEISTVPNVVLLYSVSATMDDSRQSYRQRPVCCKQKDKRWQEVPMPNSCMTLNDLVTFQTRITVRIGSTWGWRTLRIPHRNQTISLQSACPKCLKFFF